MQMLIDATIPVHALQILNVWASVAKKAMNLVVLAYLIRTLHTNNHAVLAAAWWTVGSLQIPELVKHIKFQIMALDCLMNKMSWRSSKNLYHYLWWIRISFVANSIVIRNEVVCNRMNLKFEVLILHTEFIWQRWSWTEFYIGTYIMSRF